MPSHFPQWYEAFLRRPDMQSADVDFLALYRGHRLAAVFPMTAQTSGRLELRQLRMPAAPQLDVLPDAILGAGERPTEVFDALLRSLRRHPSYRCDSLTFHGVLEHSHVARCVTDRSRLSFVSKQAAWCCVVPVTTAGEGQAALSKKFRANLRNAGNRLRAAGTVEFTCHAEPDAVNGAFDVFVELEASGWKARGDHAKEEYSAGKAMSLDPAKAAFHRHLVQAFSRTGNARIYQLDVDGTAVAAQIAFVLNDVCYMLKTAYADAYARLSPGHLLVERVLRHHAERGDASLINFISNYRWLGSWNPERWRYVSFEVFNRTPKGCLRGVQRHAARWRKNKLPLRRWRAPAPAPARSGGG